MPRYRIRFRETFRYEVEVDCGIAPSPDDWHDRVAQLGVKLTEPLEPGSRLHVERWSKPTLEGIERLEERHCYSCGATNVTRVPT